MIWHIYYVNLIEEIIGHQKLRVICQELRSSCKEEKAQGISNVRDYFRR